MSYDSVDHLQKILVKDVFHYAKDAKKAAGRALGTLVEIITFYLLKSWGFEHSVAIEKSLAEYGNPDITHNVEYSLHPIIREHVQELRRPRLPLTAKRILDSIGIQFPTAGIDECGNVLLSSAGILRNSCVVGKGHRSMLVVVLDVVKPDFMRFSIVEQLLKPYAMFECKRVGVEEGMRKGPQTIEKAKQGAYVAKSVSALHKVRTPSGELRGIIYDSKHIPYSKPYAELIQEIVGSSNPELLRDFILTVGVVSNHGNWFTMEDHNKELKVLAQSYDWLLFLTDRGLSEFISELLLQPKPLLEPARNAFVASYAADKKRNSFTKVQMDYKADQVLQKYFRDNEQRIDGWFNVIAPREHSVKMLQSQLSQLRDKNWRKVHSL